MVSPPSPNKNWVRPHLGNKSVAELFDQIKVGLEEYNQREQQQQMDRRNQISNQYASLLKTASEENSTTAKKPAASDRQGEGELPILFGSQLKLPMNASRNDSSDRSPHHKSKSLSAPESLEFELPKFTFSDPFSTSNAFSKFLNKTLTPPFEEPEAGHVSHSTHRKYGGSNPPAKSLESLRMSASLSGMAKPRSPQSTLSSIQSGQKYSGNHSSSVLQDEVDTCTTRKGKRKSCGSTDAIDLKHYSNYDFNMYSCCPGAMSAKEWTKEEKDSLIAFANKWIPDVKKRRVEKKK